MKSAVTAASSATGKSLVPAHITTMLPLRLAKRKGSIVVMCAGTSDLPVADEAAVTADFMGNEVLRVNDVGVAGLHRLLSHMPEAVSYTHLRAPRDS